MHYWFWMIIFFSYLAICFIFIGIHLNHIIVIFHAKCNAMANIVIFGVVKQLKKMLEPHSEFFELFL